MKITLKATLQLLKKKNLLLEGKENTSFKSGKELPIYTDHRKLKEAGIFVCVKGDNFNSHSVALSLLKQGHIIIIEEEISYPTQYAHQVLKVKSSRRSLSELIHLSYGNPEKKLKFIGITGSNGKTTCATLIFSMLKEANVPIALISTIKVTHKKQNTWVELKPTHTTPDPKSLCQYLSEFIKNKVSWVVMEVSSHAIDQERIACLDFDVCLFTNLSHEHLDYHHSLENYFQTKKRLFTGNLKGTAIICTESSTENTWGERLKNEIYQKMQTLPYKIQTHTKNLKIDPFGISGILLLDNEGTHQVPFKSSLIGEFNSKNIIGAALVVNEILKKIVTPPHSIEKSISAGIERCVTIEGRLEKLTSSKKIHVFIDFAHTPDALDNVLRTLTQFKTKSLITVFGCGGNRDPLKRKPMGEIASHYSDLVILTNDNPRFESPESILSEIQQGVTGNFKVIPDRTKAIQEAIRLAEPGDLILIAGKGHEETQIFADPENPRELKKVPFSDREVANGFLIKKSSN